jgi:hypothetical protein
LLKKQHARPPGRYKFYIGYWFFAVFTVFARWCEKEKNKRRKARQAEACFKQVFVFYRFCDPGGFAKIF